MVKIKRHLTGFGQSDPPEDMRAFLRDRTDPMARLNHIEKSIKEWLLDPPAAELVDALQELQKWIEKCRELGEKGDFRQMANHMYLIGEAVGRLNHVEGWHANLRSKIGSVGGGGKRGEIRKYERQANLRCVEYISERLLSDEDKQEGITAKEWTAQLSGLIKKKPVSVKTMKSYLTELDIDWKGKRK